MWPKSMIYSNVIVLLSYVLNDLLMDFDNLSSSQLLGIDCVTTSTVYYGIKRECNGVI